MAFRRPSSCGRPWRTACGGFPPRMLPRRAGCGLRHGRPAPARARAGRERRFPRGRAPPRGPGGTGKRRLPAGVCASGGSCGAGKEGSPKGCAPGGSGGIGNGGPRCQRVGRVRKLVRAGGVRAGRDGGGSERRTGAKKKIPGRVTRPGIPFSIPMEASFMERLRPWDTTVPAAGRGLPLEKLRKGQGRSSDLRLWLSRTRLPDLPSRGTSGVECAGKSPLTAVVPSPISTGFPVRP